MKRSFYEMLGIGHDADQAQIDAAYAQATARLSAGNLRGVTEAVMETQLIRDGYRILSSPEQRARYDAKLLEAEPGAKLMIFPDDSYGRRRLGIGTVVLVALSAVLGTIVYRHLSLKMDEVRIEHVQAVARHKDEQPKGIVITPNSVVNASNATPQR
ncbi:MAG: DnaJ domain-containing protein [Betaproteobacteria bacterium]|nr:DnaJ domain-containing protein [Betaproteobacteria bacterium]